MIALPAGLGSFARPIASGGGASFPDAVFAAGTPTWYCRHNNTTGTVAENIGSGADGAIVGSATLAQPALYAGGELCYDNNGSGWVDIPASCMPSTCNEFTLGILLKRNSAAGLQAIIDRDAESGTRKWQWRFESGPNCSAIKIQGSVQSYTGTNLAANGETVLAHLRVTAGGVSKLYKNGVLLATASPNWGVVDYGTAAIGLRIGRRIQGDSAADHYVAESMIWLSAIAEADILAQAEACGLA